MHHSVPLILGLATTLTVAVTPVGAGPLTLSFPGTVIQTGQQADAPVSYGLAIGAFDGTTVPVQNVQGALDRRAFRVDGIKTNTLGLIQTLQAQLEQAGYAVRFQCDTTECGGFDFRFALTVLPEPQMHVDLGDFRYMSAQTAAGDAVDLLVSRAADQGFVQATFVSAGAGPAPDVTLQSVTLPDQAAAPTQTNIATPEPPAPNPPAAEPAPAPPTTGSLGDLLQSTGSVALDDLVFASGKADLQDQDYPSLTALATWLAAHPDLTVTLVGHTDASGTLSGNVALSKQRAASVRDHLIAKFAVPAGQIDAQGAGYLAPRASNQTPEGRQQNRRVEVMLTSTPVK